jgi:hypothetical protein
MAFFLDISNFKFLYVCGIDDKVTLAAPPDGTVYSLINMWVFAIMPPLFHIDILCQNQDLHNLE